MSDSASRFEYDTDGTISASPFHVNIAANVLTTSARSNVILTTRNNDIGLPASGVLVWHVDERILRTRMGQNLVNADSSFHGVRLVEADGVSDLGVTFVDALYNVVFDYGGAQDVFPHRTLRSVNGETISHVNGFGPYTRPSTRSNDGGHTFLNIKITTPHSASPREEITRTFQNNIAVNYSDSVFLLNVRYDHLAHGWPRRAAPSKFFDPLVAHVARSSPSNNGNGNNDNNSVAVLALLDTAGRFYLFGIDDGRANVNGSYGDKTVDIDVMNYRNEIGAPVSINYFDDVAGAFTFPSAINGAIFIPASSNTSTVTERSALSRSSSRSTSRPTSRATARTSSSSRPTSRISDSGDHVIYIYPSINIADKITIALDAAPTTYVSGVNNNTWAIGLANGRVLLGDNNFDIIDTIRLDTISSSQINALAAINNDNGFMTAIQNDGTLSVINNDVNNIVSTKIENGIPPFTITTADLDNNGQTELIITDSRQGVWVYTLNDANEIILSPGWTNTPNDWANTYHYDPSANGLGHASDRQTFRENLSSAAIADIDRDGHLDIIIGGTNGIYALNRRGVLVNRWPAYLDNRYWNLRGSVTNTPVVVSTERSHPLVLFSSPTGERATFGVTKIEKACKENGVITFRREDNTLDSLWGLTPEFIDTVLTIGDSLIYPYIMPGGFIDALSGDARRPLERGLSSWAVPQSRWPLSIGASAAASPVAWRNAPSDTMNIFAVARDGSVYRWKMHGIIADSLYWPQTGFDAARSFAYGGAKIAEDEIVRTTAPITFWNYPNPTQRDDTHTTFKYKFSGPATNVRLDIYTITGRRMNTFHMRDGLTGDYPVWNEFQVDLRRYGPGVYRARMEATINGTRHSRFWKMAVTR